MAFGLGSQVGLPLVNKSGNPLNGFEVAQNVAEVLAYDSSVRYIGLGIYCIDEGSVYRFKSGTADADFVIDSSSAGIIIVDDYSALPSSTIEQIAYCKNEYIDTAVTPNITYSEGFYLYDLNENKWLITSSKVEEQYPEWKTGTDYAIEDTVTYNGKKYRCIADHTSTDFTTDDTCWIECKEVYYVLTKEKHADMVAKGLITEDTADMYIITNADEEDEISAIYEDYSLFPVTLDKEIIVYAKNDYEDIATSTIYKKGFYLYNLDTNAWELIGSSGEVEVGKEENPVYIETVTIDDTDEEIEATKTVQKIGMEETTILVANQDSADGTTIKVGDVISITKVINGIEVYSYHILDDNELYNPFLP